MGRRYQESGNLKVSNFFLNQNQYILNMVYIVALLVGINNATRVKKCRHKLFSMMRLDEATQLKKWI